VYRVIAEHERELAGHDDHPIACVRCGYDLRGLELDHPCPECGVPVAASASKANLPFAAPWWLRSLRAGLMLLLVSLAGLASVWVLLFVLVLAEIDLRGEPAIADALFRPALGLSLIFAIMGVLGAMLAFRRDPGDRQPPRRPEARRVSVILAASSGVMGMLALVPGLLGGKAGPFVFIVLALCLSGLSLTAIPVFAALLRRSPARSGASAGALALLVGGTEAVLFVYAAFLTLLPRAPFVRTYVASLFIVLVIAIPACAFFYLRFLWLTLRAVRAALAAQGDAGRAPS
jgi:hypothetical protein